MAGASDSFAILFADIEGSTRVYEELGNLGAHEVMSDSVSLIVDAVARSGGRVDKTIGDEVISTYASASSAMEAACTIQQSLADAVLTRKLHMGVKVGFHAGPVVLADGDVFGNGVNLAARMVSLPKPGQILTTRQVVDALPMEQRGGRRRIDLRAVKGRGERIEIFEVIWQSAGLTAMYQAVPDPQPAASYLLLRYGDPRVDVGDTLTVATIGRDLECDLVVSDSGTSRRHARAELRQNKFVLVDQSTNGTIVTANEGEQIYLRRAELMLQGSGIITVSSSDSGAGGEGAAIEFEFQSGSNAWVTASGDLHVPILDSADRATASPH